MQLGDLAAIREALDEAPQPVRVEWHSLEQQQRLPPPLKHGGHDEILVDISRRCLMYRPLLTLLTALTPEPDKAMAGEVKRILIWGKTYPELSNSHKETVCTGGSTADGKPVRIYPVPLRYLPRVDQYKLYSWVEAPVEPSRKDHRPESCRITDPRQLRVVGQLGTQRGWLDRRRVVFADRSWHYDCLEDLKERQRTERSSLGFIKVGAVDKVDLVDRSDDERQAHEQKLRALSSVRDMFGSDQRHLEFLPFRVRLHWRCSRMTGDRPCPGHTASVMDWGLGELGRREGAAKAHQKMESLADVTRYHLHLYMGNLKARQHIFGIVGLWYPLMAEVKKYPVALSLFDQRRAEELPQSQDAARQLGFL